MWKARGHWAKPPDFVLSFPVMCPRRGSNRNLSCLAWTDFSHRCVTRSSKTFLWTSPIKTWHILNVAGSKFCTKQSGKLVLFLPEAVEIEIISVKVQERLGGVVGPVRLQHGGAGGDDSGLARGMDGFELELGAHPQAAMGPSVSHNFHLWEGTWAGINTELQLHVMNGSFSVLDSQSPAVLKWKGCSEPGCSEECLTRGNWGCLC